MIHHGDCLEVMAAMEPESVDAIVTDPPYSLSFMGKTWDRDHDHRPWAEAAYRVAKPSSYLLAFGGTRTVHRMTVALEDAGWIIRDMLVWAYASGFPKSKASLKPAWEPIVMARKPGPLRELAIDACRIALPEGDEGWNVPQADLGVVNPARPGAANGTPTNVRHESARSTPAPLGRWPANVILTDPIFDGGVEGVVGGGEVKAGVAVYRNLPDEGGSPGNITFKRSQRGPDQGYGDSGTYSRFFLIPKADRADREPVLGGLTARSEGDGTTVRNARCSTCGKVKFAAESDRCHCTEPTWQPSTLRQNVHPTVKPTELMRHLVRLVTPSGGLVLDPFLGSGTTGLACELEGFPWIGIEREAEYVAIAEARLNGTQRGLGLAV